LNARYFECEVFFLKQDAVFCFLLYFLYGRNLLNTLWF